MVPCSTGAGDKCKTCKGYRERAVWRPRVGDFLVIFRSKLGKSQVNSNFLNPCDGEVSRTPSKDQEVGHLYMVILKCPGNQMFFPLLQSRNSELSFRDLYHV